MLEMRRLDTASKDFPDQLQEVLSWETVSNDELNKTVIEIITNVQANGDQALVDYCANFDQWEPAGAQDLQIPKSRQEQAWSRLENEKQQALQISADRIKAYAEHQKLSDWSYTEADGTLLGQQITPLDRVGLYVPGGKASYPSTVLMNAIPAKVAGVNQLVICVPTPGGEINELVLAAAWLCGVDQIFALGGAQAVAALAYGTESIPAVDKIVGPGNSYVAAAKRIVFGQVGIDMIAGPSEILIICDGRTNPDWIAMDLFSQAEHDEDAQAILITPNAGFIEKVTDSIDRLLEEIPRRQIIESALKARGAIIKVADLDEAATVANRIAPEHLELSVEDPERLVKKIKHAGAIFMGRFTCEALGDYCVGPNHVLPTSRTARFASPLGVYDFQKRSSLIMASMDGADTLGKIASTLAQEEGLIAHARSAQYRLKP